MKIYMGGVEGCTLYASCESCMMCMGAIFYSGITKIVYAATLQDSSDYYRKEMITNIEDLAKYSNKKLEIVKGLHREKAIEVLKEKRII